MSSTHPKAAKGLTRESVVRGALAELDESGLDALSLRGVARRLGVQAPALYWHVRDKRDLLDEIGTELWRPAVLAAVAAAERDEPQWHAVVTAFARTLRASLLSHRDGARAASGAVITDDALLRRMEPALERLTTVGHDSSALVTLVQTAQHATVGFCIAEQHRDAPVDLVDRARRLGDAPLVAASGTEILGDPDRRFEAMLALLVTAGEQTVGRQTVGPQAVGPTR